MRSTENSILRIGILAASIHWTLAAGATAAAAQTPTRQQQEWGSISRLPNFWEGTWQGVSDLYLFPDPVTWTPAAAQYVASYKAKPIDDTPFANCMNPGMPFVMNIAAMPIKFLPSPGLITIYIEGFGVSRFIHTDGRKIEPEPNPTYYGTSVGHWEGDTLVVDSRGFVKETLLQIGQLPPAGVSPRPRPVFKEHGPNLRFVERMRMKDFNTLEITTTIYDDTIFAKPYESTRYWHRHTDRLSEPQEWVCSDNRDFYDNDSGVLEHNVKEKAISR